MSEQIDPNVYDDEGQFIGTMVEADDGSAVLVNEAGQIVAAVDQYAQPLDPSEFQFATEDQQAAEFAERMAASEQRLAEMEATPPQVAPIELPDEDRAIASMQRQREHIDQSLGRPTTQTEAARLADYALRDAEAGGELPDLVQAAHRLADEGRLPLHDLDSHQGRVDYATERLREQSGEIDYSGQEARRAETYDEDTHQGRVDKALDALHGHDVGPPAYDPELT